MSVDDFFTNESSEIVQEQMGYLKSKADEALTNLYASLEDMRRLITSADTPGGNIDYDYVDDDIDSAVAHLRPTSPTFPNTDGIDAPQRYDLIEIDVPVFPDVPSLTETAPDNQFTWTEEDYQSTLLNELTDSLTDWIINGGTGLGATIIEAIWTNARTRLTEEWERAYNDAETYDSSRGFNIPTGPKMAMLERVNAEFNRSLADLNREITIEEARLAQNNTQFAHTASIDIEKLLSGHFNAVKNRLVQAAKDMVTTLYDIYRTKVEAYSAEVQAIGLAIDAEGKKADVQIAINKGRTDVTVADTERYKAEIDAVLGVIDGLAKVYAAEVKGYEADIEKSKIDVAAKVDRMKTLVQQSTNETNLAIKEWEVSLTGYIQTLGLNVEVSKAIATVLSQIAASSLQALHTSAGLSDGTSRRFDRSDNTNYNHDM